MKVLILDDTEKGDLFIYGGYIVDSEDLTLIKKEIRTILSKYPHLRILSEYKWNRSNTNDLRRRSLRIQIEQATSSTIPVEIIELEDGFETSLNFDGRVDALNDTALLSVEDVDIDPELDLLIKKEILAIYEKYAEKYFYCLFPAASIPSKKIELCLKCVAICKTRFEDYLLEKDEKGIILLDVMSYENQPTVIRKITSYKNRESFKRVHLFLPQTVSDETFSPNDIFLGALQQCLDIANNSPFIENLKSMKLERKNFYISRDLDEDILSIIDII